jgi:hypothetical protein
MSKNQDLTATSDNNQTNIEQHSNGKFSDMVQMGLKNGGIHVNASKGHGKSRLLFSMAKQLSNLENCRVLIFDGSEAWLYGYDSIPVFTVQERDIILANDVKNTLEIEQYQLKNWDHIALALRTYKDILFRLKTRKPSKRGFFVRTVINYVDALQRAQRETTENNEPKLSYAFIIEEAQDTFNSRSTTRLEAEEFLTVFNEARNQKEAFYTASQRLTDFSKTIRSKQLYCIGRINAEDMSGALRRIEKEHKLDFAKIQARTWFFEGETFVSPEWKQAGKPYQINHEIKQLYMANLKPEAPTKRENKAVTALRTLGMLLVSPFKWAFQKPQDDVLVQTIQSFLPKIENEEE